MDDIKHLTAQIAQLEANVREIREFMGKQGQAIMDLSKRASGPSRPIAAVPLVEARDRPETETPAEAYKRGYEDGLAIGRRVQ